MDSTPSEILKKYWGYDYFHTAQEKVIHNALQKKDVLALLPTGGGKSICFQVPALCIEGICIVISPLIALMNDQVKTLKNLGIKAEMISSGMSPRQIDIVLDNCKYGKIKFLYLSPERIKSLFVQARLQQMNINFIAVDEAHCISQWGHDFRPAYKEIRVIRELAPDAPIIAVTATANKKVANDIIIHLDFNIKNIIRSSFKRVNIFYQSIQSENKLVQLQHILKPFKGCGIVYIRSRKQTESVAKMLNKNGVSADYYHAGVSIDERKKSEANWKSNKTKIIVATSAFGMGIDQSNVRLVIHYGLPATMEEYYQESGRAGRDGKPSTAVLLFNKEDILNNQKLLSYRFPSRSELKSVYQSLGNYSQIAVGSGQDEGFEFDIKKFSNRYEMHPIKVHYCIGILENVGLLFTSDDCNASSKLKILQSRREIEIIVDRNDFQAKLLALILRSYTGLFNNYVKISESDLATRLESSVLKIKKGLEIMERTHVVHYQAQNFLPRIIYSTPRQKTDSISISKDLLEYRAKVGKTQLDYMIQFATEKVKCRTNISLFYFDEVPKGNCGNCDNCVGNKNAGNISEFISTILSNEKINLANLLIKSPFSRNDTIQEIRKMMDDGKVINDCGFLLNK